MSLDDAIQHSEEIAQQCGPCAEEHQQLALWLKELKELRSKIECQGCSYLTKFGNCSYRRLCIREKKLRETFDMYKEKTKCHG